MHLNELPEDILVIIFQNCLIDDIFALRLSSHHINHTIATYEKTILPASARLTIPETQNARLYEISGKDYSITWLKRLIPRYLASCLLACPGFRNARFIGWHAIKAEDESGDALRERLENGWCVLQKLARISSSVYSPPMLRLANSLNRETWSQIQTALSEKLALSRGGAGTGNYAFIAQKEEMVHSRRCRLVEEMSQRDAADYMLTLRLLSKALRYHPRFLAKYGDSGGIVRVSSLAKDAFWGQKRRFEWPGKMTGQYYWFEDSKNDALTPIAPWFLWFILHTGPSAFWTQWSSPSETDDVSTLAWSLWENQDQRTATKRINLASELDLDIRRKCLQPGKIMKEGLQNDYSLFVAEALLTSHLSPWQTRAEFVWEYRDEERDRREEEMVEAGRHPMEKVPFFVYLGRQPVENMMGGTS